MTSKPGLQVIEQVSTQPPEGWVPVQAGRCNWPREPSSFGFVAEAIWRSFFNKEQRQEYFVQIFVPPKGK